MKIVVDTRDGPLIVALSLATDDGRTQSGETVGDVLDALPATAGFGDVVSVDGVPVRRDDRLASLPLHPGSRLAELSEAFRQRASLGSIDVVAGLDSGIRQMIQPGRYLVGRSEFADVVVGLPTVSRRHARLEVSNAGALAIADVGSVNGVRVDDRKVDQIEPLAWGQAVRLGSATVRARRPSLDAPHHLAAQRTHAGTGTLLVFNRMPRQELPESPVPLELPVRKSPEHYRPRFSWALIVAPLIMGVAMALLWNPLYALFMILSPIMSLMNLWEDKHRLRREHKQIEKAFAQNLERFEADLCSRLVHERQRREDRHVDLAELRRRASAPSVHLWERRPGHADFLEVTVGHGHLRLDTAVTQPPEVQSTPKAPAEPEVVELLDRVGMLQNVPVEVSLESGSVTGVTGRRSVAQSVVRSFVGNVVCNQGPADVELVVLCSADQSEAWGWVGLLPHVADRRSATNKPLIATTVAAAADIVARQHGTESSFRTVVIVDGPEFHAGRHAAVRALAGLDGCALVVIAESLDWFPSQTSVVIETAGDDGIGLLVDPSKVKSPVEVVLDGMSSATGWALASALARFDDPEVSAAGAGIPNRVSLGSVLGGPIDPNTIARRWAMCRNNPGLPTPIGSDEHGPVVVDLVTDGPHALIGGTTGSGKSELLRSMIASMSASADAEHLAFLLIDYKGGSAFDRCADLPHTVGVVTDLDPQLSERALRCLNAELEYRERLLRKSGADSIESYRRRRDGNAALEPLPRLVVVIDEFATLVSELPEFVDSLVGVAQRGRSLGVHLVLATQRPSGSINDNIRTNTNLRIALRMLDSVDSVDVIGTDAAASIGRDAPGRACLRLGPGQLVNFQSALATGPVSEADVAFVSPVGFGQLPLAALPVLPVLPTLPVLVPALSPTAEMNEPEPRTDLDVLVESIAEVHRAQGFTDPRCPWPAPLDTTLLLGEVRRRYAPFDEIGALFGEVDDPGNQQKIAAQWNPTAGNGFVAGTAKSGRTSTLRTLVIAACQKFTPDQLHLYVLDLGRGEFGDLAAIPHVGAVVGPVEFERQRRLLHLLAREIKVRKAGTEAPGPPILFVLDGLDTFRRENDDRYDLLDLLDTIYLDGPSVGVYSLVSASTPTELRHFAAATRFRLYLRTSDTIELREIGVLGAVDPDPPAGRGYLAPHGLEVQVALCDDADVEVAASHEPAKHPPMVVGILENELSRTTLTPKASLDGDRLWIPLGLRSADLVTAGFSLARGDHALVVGPGRSGKTSALLSIAWQLMDSADCVVRWLGDQSPAGSIETVSIEALAAFRGHSGRVVVLIDDVETISDHEVFMQLLAQRDSPVHLIAAGRVDLLRSAYGHWTNEFKQTRRGVLLWPDILDGDVVGIDLPSRTTTPAIPGRGVLVQNGDVDELQLAR